MTNVETWGRVGSNVIYWLYGLADLLARHLRPVSERQPLLAAAVVGISRCQE